MRNTRQIVLSNNSDHSHGLNEVFTEVNSLRERGAKRKFEKAVSYTTEKKNGTLVVLEEQPVFENTISEDVLPNTAEEQSVTIITPPEEVEIISGQTTENEILVNLLNNETLRNEIRTSLSTPTIDAIRNTINAQYIELRENSNSIANAQPSLLNPLDFIYNLLPDMSLLTLTGLVGLGGLATVMYLRSGSNIQVAPTVNLAPTITVNMPSNTSDTLMSSLTNTATSNGRLSPVEINPTITLLDNETAKTTGITAVAITVLSFFKKIVR